MTWIKLWNRKHTLQQNYLGRYIWLIKNPYFNLKNILWITTEKNKYDFYAEENEWNKLMDRMAKPVFDKNYLSKNLAQFTKGRKKIKEAAFRLSNPHQLKRLSNKELLKKYLLLKKEHQQYPYFFWSPWAINQVTVPWFIKKLKSKFPREADRIFEIITVPTQDILMEKQKLELLRLKMAGHLTKKISQHVKKYQWLSVYSLLDKPYTARDFLDQIQDIKNPHKYLQHWADKVNRRKRDYQLVLKKLQAEPKLKRIAEILNKFAWLRTERVDVWREVLFLIKPFYRELEKRMGLEANQAPHLTYEEVVDFLSKNKLPKKSEVRAGELLHLKNRKCRIIRKKEQIDKIIKKELGSADYSKIKIIKGQPACLGKVRGRVRIIMTPEDCVCMKKGEILVSNMTHPDYVMGIKKAAAIVTDEGGISCHAAIISRELSIPCVIGIKIATDVLKDGDLIDVNANRGVITVVKRKQND